MKRQIKQHGVGARLAAAALACGIAGGALAGSDSTPGRAMGPVMIEHFSFEGGSLGDFVEQVRASSPAANIVVDTRLMDFSVPPMDLRAIDLESLMWVLETATGDWNNVAYRCEPTSHRTPDGAVYRLDGVAQQQRTSRGRAVASMPAHMTRVESVAETVDAGMPAEAIVSAMRLAVEIGGHASDDMTITFHEPTQLMILHGPSSGISICTDVLDQVRQSAASMDFDDAEGAEAAVDRPTLVSVP